MDLAEEASPTPGAEPRGHVGLAAGNQEGERPVLLGWRVGGGAWRQPWPLIPGVQAGVVCLSLECALGESLDFLSP